MATELGKESDPTENMSVITDMPNSAIESEMLLDGEKEEKEEYDWSKTLWLDLVDQWGC